MSTKGGRRGHLTKALNSHIKNIEETLQMLDKPAPPSLDKVDWSEVIKFGDEVSKQATIAGMLWNGEDREVKELEDNMEAYFNILQGFLLTCHGSTVLAGPTLHEAIRTSVKKIVDSSLSLLKEAVSIYDSRNPSKGLTIPQLSGSVWVACDGLKKAPTSNCTAIVRSITQVALSVKDVLREMKELKPIADDDADAGQSNANNESDDSDGDGGIGEDLSPEEMIVAQLVVDVTRAALEALKELIRSLSGLLKSSTVYRDSKGFIDTMERILGCCREIGSQVSELGACVYPPQEFPEMIAIARKVSREVGEVRKAIEKIVDLKDKLLRDLQAFDAALATMDVALGGDIESEVEKLAL